MVLPKISFKKVEAHDLPQLLAWFKEPHVQQWWPIPEPDQFFEKFLEKIRSKDTFPYIILVNDIPIGYIQYYYINITQPKTGAWLPPLPLHTTGTDQFIGNPQFLYKGYGTACIKAFLIYLTTILEPQTTTIIVDPDPTNLAAIRCYEKVGFVPINTYKTPTGNHLLMQYNVQ